MAYNINLTDGTLLVTIPNNTYVPAGTQGGVLDLTLYGKGKLDYGRQWNENFVHLLENFADSDEPDFPLDGMIWFDKGNTLLKYWNDTGLTWETLVTSGAGASTFVNVIGDTMTGNLEFPIPDDLDPDEDSPGILFTAPGSTDNARIYVEHVTAETSALVIQIADNVTSDVISLRHLTTSGNPVEVLYLTRRNASGPGIMAMTRDDGTGLPGASDDTIIFNEGGGLVNTGPDIRGAESLLLAAGNHMYFNIEDGITTTIAGSTEFKFNKGSATSSATSLATITNTGEFQCANDADTSAGKGQWYLGVDGPGSNHIDFGSRNAAITQLRAVNANGSFMRVKGADGSSSNEFVTKSQLDAVASAGSSSAVIRKVSSTGVTYTGPGQLVTWNHNMGVEPYALSVIMQCLIAEQGYSVGNRIWMSVPITWAPGGSGGNEDFGGFAVWHNSVNQLQLRVASGTGVSSGITWFNKSTGAITRLYAPKWAFYFRALG